MKIFVILICGVVIFVLFYSLLSTMGIVGERQMLLAGALSLLCMAILSH